jgi:predicted transcriptional regulator of viral defense system
MIQSSPNSGLEFLDDLVAEGHEQFTFDEAAARLGRSATATANALRRLRDAGLIDRVQRGRYVVRHLGVLGTAAAAEDTALAVSATFSGIPHRIGYRTALDEHDLLSHPVRTIQVATAKRVRMKLISGRPLITVLEPKNSLLVGATATRNETYISNLERALLDAATRPKLVGGAAALVEATAAAAGVADPDRLMTYATRLRWSAALRRIGSISDTLELDGLAEKFAPFATPSFDLALQPGQPGPTVWRDRRWRVRWMESPEEMKNIAQR